MFLIYIILFILLAGFVNYLIQKFKKDKKYNRKFYNFEDNNSIVAAIFITIFSFVGVNAFLNDPTFTDQSEQIEYGKKTTQPWLESQVYQSQLQSDTNNLDLHFKFIETHFDENQEMGPSVKNFNQENTFLFQYYTKWSKSTNPQIADKGHLFIAIYYYFKGDFTLCQSHLEEVKNDKLKYLNTYRGRLNYYNNRPKEAFECFAKEIKRFGDVKGAYEQLSGIYNYEERYDELGGDKKPNYNSLVGKKLEFKAYRAKGLLSNILPVSGEIIKREKISGFSGWFLVKLYQPLKINKAVTDHILVRAKERQALINNKDNTIVSFVVIPKMELLSTDTKNLKDFAFIDWAVAN